MEIWYNREDDSMKKRNFKEVTKKLLAGLLTLAMICGIGPTYMTAKAETPSAVMYDATSEHPAPDVITYFTLSGAPAHTGGNKIYYPTDGGIYVNGESGSRSWFFRESDTSCFINWHENGFTQGFTNGTIVRIDGTFREDGGTNEFKLQGNFIYRDGQWLFYNEELEVSLNATQSGASWMFFTTATDATYMGSGERQWPVIGGFYVKKASGTDYTLAEGWHINHYGAGQYHVWRDAGFNFETGDEIYMDAWFGAAHSGPASRLVSPVWVLGENGWYVKKEEVPAFETTVSDTGTDQAQHMFFGTAADDGKFTGSRMHYFASEGGIYVNGNLLSTSRFMRDGGQYFIIYFPDLGITEADGMTLRIDGVFASEDGTSVLDLTSGTFVYDAATAQWTMYNEEVEANALMTWEDTSFRFEVGTNNVMPYEGNVIRRNPVSGGLYVDGELRSDIELYQHGATSFHTYAPGFIPADGTTMKIDAVLGNGGSTLKVTSDTYIYQNGIWGSIKAVAYDAEAFTGYRADLLAPTTDGYVFAGWYADEDCKTVLNADTVENVAYAKFVNASVLTAKAQATANIDEYTDYADMRFVTTVDSLNYREVGLYITIEGLGQEKKSTTTVYKQLLIVGEGATTPDERITPQGSFCKTSQYFATYSYWNIPNKYFNTKFTVIPYWVTLDGTEVCGPEAVRTVNMVAKIEPELILATNGTTEYVIVRGENAAPAEVTAASELQDYLAQISGVTVPIVTDSTKAQSKEIVVGKTNRESAGFIDRTKLGQEGFVIKTTGGKLWLAGGGERGTLYSVYAFLEEYLGCRFYTSAVEKVPKKGTVQIDKIKSDEQIPVFELRDPEWKDYTATDISVKRNVNSELWGRNLPESVGDGITYAYGNGGHTFFGFVDPNTYFSSHPEYFSMNENGNRTSNGQLCLTNENVLQLVIAGVRQWLAANPDADMISVSQNDVAYPCLCNNCKAVYNDEGGAYSGTLIRFVNAIAEDIREDYPNVIVDTFAYQYTRSAPTKTKPADNVSVTFCTIEGCFSHAHSENCAQGSNASYLDGHSNTITKDLTDWTAICKHLYVFDYSSSVFHNGMTVPNFESLQKNILFYAQKGVDGVRSEGFTQSASAELGELRSYLISKLLWDPYMSEEEYYAHMDDFLTGVYGPGGTYVREYIDLAEELTDGIHFNLTPEPHELYPLTIKRSGTVSDSSRAGLGDQYLFFDASISAGDMIGNEMEYDCISGGMYVDGQFRDDMFIIRNGGQNYFIFFGWFNYTPKLGSTIQIDGTFACGKQKITLKSGVFEYNGAGEWNLTSTVTYNLPESLTVNMVKNYTSTDWTSYWNWYADVEENTITLEGKRLFEKAIQAAETDMQRRQLEKIYSQVEYILSYYYKAKIDAGNETFAQMIRDFIAAHASSFSEEEIATLPKIIKNRALAQLYPEYEAYNRALAEKWVQCGLEQYRSTYSISNWKNFNYANIPLYWSSYDKVVDLDTPFKADGTLWVETSSADSHPYNDDWSCKYWAYTGGIYINGVKADIPLIKVYGDTYLVRPMDYGYPLTEGMRITIDGVFGDGEHVTKFNAATFVYTKNSFLGYEYVRWIKVEHLTVLGSSVQGTDLHVQVAESDSLSSSSSYRKKYNALSGGVYVDGILRESIKVAKYGSKHYVILWGDYGITPVAGMKITIDGIFGDTSSGGVKIGPVTFIYTDDYGWVLCMDIGTTGQPDSVLWLQSGVADTLVHNLDWSCRYWAKDGNIYIDGVAAALPLIKVKADTYIVYFPDFGYSVKEGMEVVIDGAFTDGTNTIRFNRTTFRYDGTLGTHGVWVKVN